MKLAILLLVLLIAPAAALTASPASYLIHYHQGEEHYTLTITNDEQRSLSVTLTPAGPLASSIDVQHELTLAPNEQKQITVTVNLPDTTQPGVLENGILIEAKPISAATVSATSALMHIIRVDTPKDGTYLAGELLSSVGILGDETKFTLSLTNIGTQPITDAKAVIRVANQEYILPPISLEPGASTNLVVSWTPTKIGVYDATAAVQYAGKQATFATSIIIGNLSVSILGLDIGSFRLGDPFRISVLSQNQWGAPLPVSAKLTVEQNGKIVASGESIAVQTQPLTITALPVFLESSAMVPGNATVLVQLFYADKTATASYPVLISVDSFTIISQQPSSPISWLPIIISVIVLLIIVIATRIFIKNRGLTKR